MHGTKNNKTLRQGCRAQRSSLIISKSKQEINNKCNNQITETTKNIYRCTWGGGGEKKRGGGGIFNFFLLLLIKITLAKKKWIKQYIHC